jgi:hypothetical protein
MVRDYVDAVARRRGGHGNSDSTAARGATEMCSRRGGGRNANAVCLLETSQGGGNAEYYVREANMNLPIENASAC